MNGAQRLSLDGFGPGFDVFGEDGCELFDVGAEIVLREDALAAVDCDAGAECIVVNESGERMNERVEVGGWDEQTIDAVSDQFRNAGDGGCDAGNLHGHGFHEDNGKALSEAGQAEDVGLRVDGADAVLIDGAFEDDVAGEIEASRVCAEGGFVGAVAGQAETDIATLVEELTERIEEQVLAFRGGETADAEDLEDAVTGRGFAGAWSWERREEMRIDAEAADVELASNISRARDTSAGCVRRN